MKCAEIQQPGPAQELRIVERPDPQPGDRQVLVSITASAVNPIDTYIRAGSIPMPVDFPYVPGCDLAGSVVAVGRNVTQFKPGDRVWASNQGLFKRQGTLAQLIAVDEDWVYPTPAEMSDQDAAAGALTGITAHLGLRQFASLQPGELVFVNGGTGGVGSMVVQFAKALGARVITTAGTEDKRDLCRKLGADVALDYNSPTLDSEIRTAAAEHGGIGLWWETQREPDMMRTIGFMKRRGRIVVMAGRQAQLQFTLGPFYVNDLQLLGFAMFNATPAEQRACAEEMNQWYVQGLWRPLVGQTFPLAQVAEAHQLQEDNTLHKQKTLSGKILVLPTA